MTFVTPDHPEPAIFPDFLRALFEGGVVGVSSFEESPPSFEAGFDQQLAALDAARRTEWGPTLPALDSMAARWAARQLYRACQFLVCRDVPGETVTTVLAEPCPGGQTAGTAYSADFFFSFLPDLFGMASQLAPEDPLVAGLRQLAREWPLSSAGIAAGAVNIEAFAGEPELLRLYVDRVTARRARDRLDDVRVRSQLRADAGLFPELLPFDPETYSS